MSCRFYRLAVDMDIHGYFHGYIHVWISYLGNTVDISMDIGIKSVISLIRFSDINNLCLRWRRRRPVVIVYSLFFLFSFLLLLIQLSHQNLRSLLLSGNSGNSRDRIKTLTELAEWSSFVVNYFIL